MMGVSVGRSRGSEIRFGARAALAWLVGGWILCAPAARASAAEPGVVWLSGASLAARLNESYDVHWSTVPLRRALDGLSRETRVAIVLDRRVDPSQRISLVQSDETLTRLLDELAQRTQLGRSALGPVIYLGPKPAAARLRTLADLRRQDARRAGVESRLLHERSLRWDELAVPREIVAQLAKEGDFTLAGLERLPHDLWPAGELPVMTLADRLTLLLNQFDLTFAVEPDGKTLRLSAIPADLPTQAKPDAPARQSRPPVEKTRKPANKPEDSDKRYTLKEAKGQLGNLITQLAGMLKLELKMDREQLKQAGVRLEQPVTLSVNQVTVDELFEKLLAPNGLTFRRDGRVIEILPAK